MAGKGSGSGRRSAPEKSGGDEPLKERYRAILVEKLTPEDLRELQFSPGHRFDERVNLDRVYKEKFQEKLRRYLHEEVLTREIIGIEALARSLKPGDLKAQGNGRQGPHGAGARPARTRSLR